ncbi:MAG: RidA family protein [Betaproteobacteria bacterium]|nr:MAG: RidA family protein [Betaproteobacteria bacterium]
MPKTLYNPKGLSEPVGPFARAVRIGDVLYISGTSALSHIPGPIWQRHLPADFETQARLTFENIRKVVEAANGSMADIFKTTAFLKDRKHYDRLADIRKEYLPGSAHVSTGLITELIREDMLIEIEAQAYLGS